MCDGIDMSEETFVDDPDGVEEAVGASVELSCAYYDNARFFFWEFHPRVGQRLTIRRSDDYPHGYRIGNQGQLQIPSLQFNHTGEYQCHAQARHDCDIFSLNASIVVISHPSVSVASDTICYNATEMAIIAGEAQGHPLPVVFLYQLYEDSMQLVVNSRVAIDHPTDETDSFTITISDLLTSDEGTYVIMANNTAGPSEPFHVTLAVKGPDRPFLSLDTDRYLIQRFEAQVPQMRCSVQPSANTEETGRQATLTWARSESVEKWAVGVVKLELDLGSFEPEEEGEYLCSAENVRGSAGPVAVYVYAPVSLPNPPSLTDQGDNQYRVEWTPPTPPSNVPIYEYVVRITHDGGPFQTERTPDTEYIFDTSSLLSGEYSVSVSVVLGDQESASTGEGEPMMASSTISVSQPNEGSLLLVIVCSVVGGVVILFLVGIFIGLFFLCYYYPHRRKLSSQQQSWSKENRLDETDQSMGNSYEPLHIPHTELPPSPSPHTNGVVTFHMDIDPKWEFARSNLKLSEVLCETRATILYRATAEGIRDKPIDVTVKALRDTATEDELKIMYYEMDQLSCIDEHPNLVSMLRVCSVEQPLYIVMEYMMHGDLLGFLRASRGHYGMYTVSPGFRNHQPPNLQLSSRDLLGIAAKVANGMRFLADRKIVHRALCCKNVLVGSGMEIKIHNIGGFDLPAEVRNPLVKWCAPEVLRDDNFSTGSDVWAFGVTLWEIVTVGATPYPDVNPANLFSELYSGMRMPRPPHCGQDV
jgi:hypothetical protein